jgi:hypothetical protein
MKKNSCGALYGELLILQLRDAQVKVEELQNSQNHLQKRLDKLKQSKLAVISGAGKEE